MSAQSKAAQVTDDVVQGGVLLKLVIFSISLALAPIATYFLSQKYLWEGNGTYAALTAVLAANIVLVGYIVGSILEDRSPTPITGSAGSSSSSSKPKPAESRKEK